MEVGCLTGAEPRTVQRSGGNPRRFLGKPHLMIAAAAAGILTD